jgi:hypothetical protein
MSFLSNLEEWKDKDLREMRGKIAEVINILKSLLNSEQGVQECDASKSQSMCEPLANNSPKEEDVEKMAEDKLKSVYQDTHNALCDWKFEYWVKNIPFGRFLKLAMIEMYNAAKTTK